MKKKNILLVILVIAIIGIGLNPVNIGDGIVLEFLFILVKILKI